MSKPPPPPKPMPKPRTLPSTKSEQIPLAPSTPTAQAPQAPQTAPEKQQSIKPPISRRPSFAARLTGTFQKKPTTTAVPQEIELTTIVARPEKTKQPIIKAPTPKNAEEGCATSGTKPVVLPDKERGGIAFLPKAPRGVLPSGEWDEITILPEANPTAESPRIAQTAKDDPRWYMRALHRIQSEYRETKEAFCFNPQCNHNLRENIRVTIVISVFLICTVSVLGAIVDQFARSKKIEQQVLKSRQVFYRTNTKQQIYLVEGMPSGFPYSILNGRTLPDDLEDIKQMGTNWSINATTKPEEICQLIPILQNITTRYKKSVTMYYGLKDNYERTKHDYFPAISTFCKRFGTLINQTNPALYTTWCRGCQPIPCATAQQTLADFAQIKQILIKEYKHQLG